jgi:hypothetical protein
VYRKLKKLLYLRLSSQLVSDRETLHKASHNARANRRAFPGVAREDFVWRIVMQYRRRKRRGDVVLLAEVAQTERQDATSEWYSEAKLQIKERPRFGDATVE